ncbi:hypothetical protein K5I29_09035 [Flavobacterium agricola]|uniref:Uncharacterized protein n=1 Tax=Flavobacterium agricola TaxID=2870839 RepID=A0ABY6LXH5_9FLAO|nr:hypothetical protein [Flavobacterium agricola]UYW00677.1 hypothetical protein K5I29_09035 [Flavobacterium agricola]
MEGKIHFKINEKENNGIFFDVFVDEQNITTLSFNHNSFVYKATGLKNYSVVIKNDSVEKNAIVNLSNNEPEKTVEITTTRANKIYNLYMVFVLVFIAVILTCYFVFAVDIYYLLIFMVIALPLVIAKFMQNNSKNDAFTIHIK